MNLTGEPNVNDIVRLGKFYRDERWSHQAKLDDEMAAYYARRARGGVSMIFCEASYYNDELSGIGYLNQPGIANAKHVAAWKKIVDEGFGVPRENAHGA